MVAKLFIRICASQNILGRIKKAGQIADTTIFEIINETRLIYVVICAVPEWVSCYGSCSRTVSHSSCKKFCRLICRYNCKPIESLYGASTGTTNISLIRTKLNVILNAYLLSLFEIRNRKHRGCVQSITCNYWIGAVIQTCAY